MQKIFQFQTLVFRKDTISIPFRCIKNIALSSKSDLIWNWFGTFLKLLNVLFSNFNRFQFPIVNYCFKKIVNLILLIFFINRFSNCFFFNISLYYYIDRVKLYFHVPLNLITQYLLFRINFCMQLKKNILFMENIKG